MPSARSLAGCATDTASSPSYPQSATPRTRCSPVPSHSARTSAIILLQLCSRPEITRWVRDGHRVIAVVSAIGNTTDTLLSRAKSFGKDISDHSVAALLATGEATSAALLALALDCAGISCAVLDETRLGLRTRGPVL